jgi:hypothetical protein
MILVKHKNPAHRGGLFGGADGTAVYWVEPQTGYLHLTRGSQASSKPGCHPQDAAEFAKFPDLFEVEKVPKAPPAPPPAAAPTVIEPTVIEAEIEPEPEAGPAFPNPNATKASWVDWAAQNGVELDSAEIQIHKKAELIEIIRERYLSNQEG